MNTFRKSIVVLVGCLGLLFGLITTSTSPAQTRAKKNSKPGAADTSVSTRPIDLNTASEQDLVDLPGIGPVLAKKIIGGRPYASVSDLSKASVPERTIKKIRPMVTVSKCAIQEFSTS